MNNPFLELLYPQLEITLQVIADRAFHGGRLAFVDIAGVPAYNHFLDDGNPFSSTRAEAG